MVPASRGDIVWHVPQVSAFRAIYMRVLAGELEPRALELVLEWARAHRTELLANWDRARRNEPILAIAPLS